MKLQDSEVWNPSLRVWVKNIDLQKFLNKHKVVYSIVPYKKNANIVKSSHYIFGDKIQRKKAIGLVINKKDVLYYLRNGFKFYSPTILIHETRPIFAFFLVRDILHFENNIIL